MQFVGRAKGGRCTLVNVLHVGTGGSRRLTSDILGLEVCCGKMMWTANHLAVRWERHVLQCEANVGGGIILAVGSLFVIVFFNYFMSLRQGRGGFGIACLFVTSSGVKRNQLSHWD